VKKIVLITEIFVFFQNICSDAGRAREKKERMPLVVYYVSIHNRALNACGVFGEK
jgi:hypothetical protein